ncbi:hypothetical protein [Saccharopolyspora sp. 5N708]|uniref:hypothetical protein n=1 Tax=Saccharopolyspora sp. 5N708 TaxID=3457424 RepID=UPI003FD0252F
MDTTGLDAAYRDLIRNAEATDSTRLSADARSLIDWTMAHLALSDRILAATARDVLSGIPAVVDNREAMDSATVEALINTTTHQERIDLVRHNAAEFTAAVQAVPEHAAHHPVRVRLVDRDGQPAADQELPWSELIRLRATQHLPGHATRLAELTQRPPR